jgi:hypothetical protein
MFTAAPTHPDDHRAHEIFHETRTRDLSRLDRIFTAAMILQFVATLARSAISAMRSRKPRIAAMSPR